MNDLLLVFLKWPKPGATKTRLIPALGAVGAAHLYRRVADLVIEATRPAGRYARLFCFTPADARERVRAWIGEEALWPQPDGDLGRRMSGAFHEAFRRGAERVALVGTDVPELSRDVVVAGLRALASADLVLGPAQDGGYYLVGLKQPEPALFEGFSWSTPGVLEETKKRAKALGLSTSLLEPLSDLDTIEDLGVHWDRVGPLIEDDPELRAAAARAIGRA